MMCPTYSSNFSYLFGGWKHSPNGRSPNDKDKSSRTKRWKKCYRIHPGVQDAMIRMNQNAFSSRRHANLLGWPFNHGCAMSWLHQQHGRPCHGWRFHIESFQKFYGLGEISGAQQQFPQDHRQRQPVEAGLCTAGVQREARDAQPWCADANGTHGAAGVVQQRWECRGEAEANYHVQLTVVVNVHVHLKWGIDGRVLQKHSSMKMAWLTPTRSSPTNL